MTWRPAREGTAEYERHRAHMEANGPIDNDAAFAGERRRLSIPVTTRERALRRPRVGPMGDGSYHKLPTGLPPNHTG